MSQPYVPPRDPTEVLGRRSAAFVIDLIFLGVIGVILLATAKHHSYYEAPSNACSLVERSGSSLCLQISDRLYVWERSAVVRTLVLCGVAGFLDLVVLQTLTGASLGKLCVGLRVVEVHGNEARFLRVLGRWLFLIIDLGCFVVGLVTTVVTHPHRRVGDLACGTYVVGVASVGHPVAVPAPPPAFGQSPSAYGAPPGAPVPPGWGTPAGWAGVPPPATVATPPGTSPTTPGEWGAVARPGPALVRSPQWEAPPPGEQPVPVARDTMAPQWATPPGPKAGEPAEPEQHAVAEPMPAPEAAPEPLGAAPQWSPIVPLTTKDDASTAESTDEALQPPPPPPAPWSPVVPASNGEPTPSPTPPPTPPPAPPAPAPPTEPSPPPPTEPEPPAPAAHAPPEPEPVVAEPEPPAPAAHAPPEPEPVVAEPEPDDDVPWWDADA